MKNKYSEDKFIGDKIKLTEIKKKFNIDKFNSILNSPKKHPSGIIKDAKERFSIFDALGEMSKVDISFFDGFTIKASLKNFFKRISNDLVYEPVIGFIHDQPYFTNNIEFGLLKCILNKKKDFHYYLIHSSWFNKDSIPQGDVDCKNCFNFNDKIDEKKLVKILYDEMRWSYKYGKIIAENVYFFKKLNWSKDKLKKCIKNSNVVFH